MNNLLYFNNNTPNYEYILKEIIIDNNSYIDDSLEILNNIISKLENYCQNL